MRLACVTAVMEHGSQEDRRNPFDKAQRIFQYVTEGASENDSKSKGNNTK